MIAGIFHKGSGLGNQLHRYVATRVLALDKGYEFGMVAPDLFKGSSFMNLDMGKGTMASYMIQEPSGKVVSTFLTNYWEEWNKFTYDPDFNFVEDNTIIDGSFEDEKYFGHRLPEISEWLKTEPLDVPDDVCVIGFRGGEYYTVPELGLPPSYYHEAIEKMRAMGINKFEVHTDDMDMAKDFFPQFKVFRDIELNWRAVRYAKYAIIANSSFYVLPRLLRQMTYMNYDFVTVPSDAITIAPRYFNRYNIKKWDYPQFYYKSFKYI